MSSIIEGYNYDIFISYRQKDNLPSPGYGRQGGGDRWVSEFVEALKTELESTFKEEISVYFDINPHNGLLETHDVDESLKEKLKCLVFIPIISRTYCDPKSFAWEHEFKAFVEQASKDQFGLKVKLPNGNVAGRVLPVRIHDLDFRDNQECESVLGGIIRGVDFIYKESGFNRPLKPDDDEKININKTKYRNQISKVALAVKEIISGLKNEPLETFPKSKEALLIEDKPHIKEKSIIVLPFENISPDPDQEYFSDGLTDEIITDLSHIHDLLVISRSSAMTFKGTKKTIPEIAQAVKVRYVLEGSVRKVGNNLRITAQLIDSVTDTHLWAEKFSGTLDDIFEIQENVSLSIAGALKLKLSPQTESLISYRPIENISVYEFHLKVRHEIYHFTEKGLEHGLELINKGLEIIGGNELLYNTLGLIYFLYDGIKPLKSNLTKINECAQNIFRLNPESPYGHYLLGSSHLLNKNSQLAVREFSKCLSGDPTNPDCMLQLVRIYCNAGKNNAAKELLEKLLVLDPLNAITFSLPGYLQLVNGEFDAAVDSYKKMYLIDPESPIFRWFYAWVLLYVRNNREAFRIIDQTNTDSPNTLFASYGMLFKNALSHRKAEAMGCITHEMEEAAKRVEYHSRALAQGYAILGEKDKALNWLENCINCGFINYPYYTEIDPFLENIRSEERFRKLMERVKYEWENFEV
jgi:TolB-like protein